MENRRSFIGRSAGLIGSVVLGPQVVKSATAQAFNSPRSGSTETVRTAFNWVPNIEWAPWYYADTQGLFAERGVASELLHGGPNVPSVAQVVAAGDADVGVASDELQLIRANEEGADFVILGAMFQRSPSGFCWLAENPISSFEDLVGKRIGLASTDAIRVDAIFRINGMEPDYEAIPMSFDPQPLIDGDADVITCYVTNQPINLELRGVDVESAPYTEFGLKAYGDVLFAPRSFVEEQRDLLVAYFAGLLAGLEAYVADPAAVLPMLTDDYGRDMEIDPAYVEAGNPAFIALYDSEFTEANGRMSIDPQYLVDEVYPSYEAAGQTDLPPVEELLDQSVLKDAHEA